MPPSESPSRDDRVNEVIAAYLEAVERGETPDSEKFIAENPEIALELRSFLGNAAQFHQFAEPTPESLIPLPLAGNSPEIQSDPNQPTMVFRQRGVSSAQNVLRYFGDYELVEEIARGGMGVVFKARQVTLNRIVAVKMILGGQLAGPEDVQRFHTEAEAAAQLDHPGIVPIYEVGQQDGQHFFSMGFVEGKSLAKRVAEGPLEPREAAELVKTISEAVQYAHDKGVIHRDLKPGNILLDKQGRPRVTDFGLAKLTESGSDLTGTGQILGTPSYMPPEQAAAQVSVVGRLSDVYSLGAILYCLLTGRPPFQAANPLETLFQVQRQDPVPPRQLNPTIPQDLDTIVLKCLDKSPSRRYVSARALAEELQRYLEGRTILARPVSRIERFWRWCKREPVVAGLSFGVILSLIVGTTISMYFAIKERQRADSESKLAIKNGVLAEEKGILATKNRNLFESEHEAKETTQRQLRIATAEKLAAMSQVKRSESPEVSLLLAVESSRATRKDDGGVRPSSHQALLDALSYIGGQPLIGHHSTIFKVAISPDGHWIVTASRDNTVRVWDLTAENPAANGHVLSGNWSTLTCVCFSPNSRWLITGSNDAARVWDMKVGNPPANPRLLIGHSNTVASVVVSPDSRWAITGSADNTARVWDLTAENPSENPRVLIGHSKAIISVSISPNSSLVVTGSIDNTQRVWDLTVENPSENPRVLTGHSLHVTSLAISPDSRWVITGSWDNTARVWDLTAENPSEKSQILSGHQRPIWNLAISPDSRWLVTGSYDRTARVWDLKAENPAENSRVLNGHQDAIEDVAISPNGRWIVTGSLDSTACVWDLTAKDPAAKPRVLRGHQRGIHSVAISPDSRWAVTGSNDNTARVWDLTAENPSVNPRVLSGVLNGVRKINRQMAISPDSRWVVTEGWEGKARVWDLRSENPAANPRTLDWHASTGWKSGINCVAISLDGRLVVTGTGSNPSFVSTGNSDKTARVWDLTAENPSVNPRVLSGHSDEVCSVAISSDNHWIVTGSWDTTARVWDLTAENPSTNPRVLSGHQQLISIVAISPDNRWVVTVSKDKSARVWKLGAETSATNSFVLIGHSDQITSVTISPNSRWLITGTGTGGHTARVWDLAAENPSASPRILNGINATFNCLAISPDSRWVVTGNSDGNARVWDLAAENPTAEPRVLSGHSSSISSVAISLDGRWIVTASLDKTTRVWDMLAANPSVNPLVLSGNTNAIGRVAISPDNRWILTRTGVDVTIQLWRWQPEDLVALGRPVARNFDRDEWKLYFPDEQYRKTFPDLPIPGDP